MISLALAATASPQILSFVKNKPSTLLLRPLLLLPRNAHSLSRFKDHHNHRTMRTRRRGFSVVCSSDLFTPRNIRWISTVSSAILMLSKGTAAQKSFLVPLFALQAPTSIVSWIKGEYGAWTAFFALLVRLFYFIPGELELPFMAILLVIVAPYQVMNVRGTQAGAIISLVISVYLAFQHFSRFGSLQRAFDQGSVIASLAIICITAASGFLLI